MLIKQTRQPRRVSINNISVK
ncbi:hypothetical protein D030_3276A, partial [Vibrio parahaemolyticus AQ3810]